MKRVIEEDLMLWKNNNIDMPLMLIGARQTGKTYILNDFCLKNFDDYVYINLENREDIASVFEQTLDPLEIIKNIEIILKRSIDVDKTVIFFDEIQVSERAITSLKYFCESDIHYKIVTAGSLLGVKVNRFKSSFPVGKVMIKYLYSMNFKEFLWAIGEELLVSEIESHYDSMLPMLDASHQKALNLYKDFLVLGGMPIIVEEYIKNGYNISHVNFEILNLIIAAYQADMHKYTENTEGIKNAKIYNSIPGQLARENKSFKYSLVDKNARKIRYESSLDWLLASNMVIKCDLVTKNESPLRAYVSDKFKVYLNDVGLLCSLSKIDYSEILLNKNEMYKGVLTENYVASELYGKFGELFYYNFDKYEIDFLIKIKGDVIPVEVKAGDNVKSKSLKAYIDKYSPLYAIRLSSKNFGYDNNIKSIPLYATFCIK